MLEITEIMAAILFKTSYFQFTNVVFAQSKRIVLYVFVQIGFYDMFAISLKFNTQKIYKIADNFFHMKDRDI